MRKQVLISLFPVVGLAVLSVLAVVSTLHQISVNGVADTDTADRYYFEENGPQYGN